MSEDYGPRPHSDLLDGALRENIPAPVDEQNKEWKYIKDEQPAPHSRYLVRRNGIIYTATPCYGLHKPWWVTKTMKGEADPVDMEKDDEWQEIKK